MLLVCSVIAKFSSHNPILTPGNVPDIETLFPSRTMPTKRVAPNPPEETQAKSLPIASGAGLFTPTTGNAGNLFRGRVTEMAASQPFRIEPPTFVECSLFRPSLLINSFKNNQ